MTKMRELLLAGSFLIAVGPIPHGLAGEAGPLIMAQQAAPEAPERERQAPKAPPTKPPPPAAKGEPPAPPAARGQPPAGQPQRTQSPPAEESHRPAQAQPPVPGQPQHPAAREEPSHPPEGQQRRPAQAQPPVPGQPPQPQQPAQGQAPAGAHPPAAQQQGQPPVPGQPPRPSTAQEQPGQPQHPPGQPPHPQPPAAQGQPLPQPPAAQGQPPHPQPPATQSQPPLPQPPAAQGQPPPPAAQGKPSVPQPPSAQGQTQPPAGQAQTPLPGGQQRPTAAAPPAPQQTVQPALTERGSILSQPNGAQGQPLRRVEDLHNERHEEQVGNQLIIREPDRVIVRDGGGQAIIRHNEVTRFLQFGREVGVDRSGGETTTIIERPDGTRIITITDDDGRLIRRVRRSGDGRDVIIIDNRDGWRSDDNYYVDLPPPIIRIPRERYIVEMERARPEIIYETLIAAPVERIERRYTLEQVRYSEPLRGRMSRVDIDTVTFDSGSWELTSDQIGRLAVIAEAINRAISRNPSEVFLIEGHTDAVGSDVDNLSLSDRRAESVALALTERFQVPAENLTTQGYDAQYLKISTQAAERQNRRVAVRRITPLLTGQNQSTGQAN